MNLELPLALLLDDNLMSSSRIAATLQQMNYRVLVASKLPETADVPQLIILQLGSRRLDGIALIAPFKEKFPNARLVGFCGHREIAIRRAAKAAGLGRVLTNDEALLGLADALR